MDEELYVTVTGFSHYYHKRPFAIGNLLVCVKNPSNKYDTESITVYLPLIGQVGVIGNSPYSTALGTMSAGRIYDKVEDKFYIRVKFVTQSKIICRVEIGNDEDFEKEIHNQLKNKDTWLPE